MFNKYRIISATMNMSDGEATDVVMKDTEKEAMDTFYNKCSSLGTNPATKACEVVVLSPNGDLVRIEKIDNTAYAE